MKRTLIRHLVLSLMLFIGLPSVAFDFQVDSICYNISNGKAEVTYRHESRFTGNSYSGNVNILDTVTYNGTKYLVTSIGKDAFYNCTNLTSVTIPSSVTSIGNYCFQNCTSLTEIEIPTSVTSLGQYCFEGCSSLKEITIPDGVTSLPNSCFSGCTSLTGVEIPTSVTSVGRYCFYYCTSLTEITIPESLSSIGRSCFRNCSALSEITIPSSVTSMSGYCFEGCSSLSKVTCLRTSPPTTNFSSGEDFGNITSTCILYVPAASVDIYKMVDGWKDFTNIYAIEDDPTAISAAKSRGVVVTAQGGIITISGLDERESVSLYTVDSKPIGTATAVNGTASFATSATGVVIAKIGEESIKIQVE